MIALLPDVVVTVFALIGMSVTALFGFWLLVCLWADRHLFRFWLQAQVHRQISYDLLEQRIVDVAEIVAPLLASRAGGADIEAFVELHLDRIRPRVHTETDPHTEADPENPTSRLDVAFEIQSRPAAPLVGENGPPGCRRLPDGKSLVTDPEILARVGRFVVGCDRLDETTPHLARVRMTRGRHHKVLIATSTWYAASRRSAHERIADIRDAERTLAPAA